MATLLFSCPPAFASAPGAPRGDPAPPDGVRLNELYASHAGADDQEFLELLGPPGQSLLHHVVCAVEGDRVGAGGGAGGDGVLERVFDLSAYALDADGYFLLGDPGVAGAHAVWDPALLINPGCGSGSPGLLENGSATLYLIDAGSAAGVAAIEALRCTDVGLPGDRTLLPASGVVLDAVALLDVASGDAAFDGAPALGPDAAGFLPAGVFRSGPAGGAWCDPTRSLHPWLDFDDEANARMPRSPGYANPPCADDPPLVADRDALSLNLGGTQALSLRWPAASGRIAWLLGSATGWSPGLRLPPGVVLPLRADAYFQHGLVRVNEPPLLRSLAFLDASGVTALAVSFPPSSEPSLAGLRLWHAALVFELGAFTSVGASNAVALALEP